MSATFSARRAHEDACAAALASLGLSPARLRRVLGASSPGRAWSELADGTHPEDPSGRAQALVRRCRPEELWHRCRALGVTIATIDSPSYPRSLAADAEAPAVLFMSGRPQALDGWPRVAVVGTRSASAPGCEVAEDIGRCLARSGAVVVSGLAAGIDSAALGGAVEAGGTAVAVLGTAHDGLPAGRQRRLADDIGQAGCLVSELPPGTESARWRFAVRNRVMAALAQLVVVVECHRQGGALYTVGVARHRNVPVAAVPGSVRSSSSEGTNALLVAGAACVRHGDDAVALLARLSGWRPQGAGGSRSATSDRGEAAAAGGHPAHVPLDRVSGEVLAALEHEAVGLDAVVLRTGESVASVALALERLAEMGLARSEGGFWTRSAPGAGRR